MVTQKGIGVLVSNFIVPGSQLGMLGGGQLGRMFAQAAVQMGYSVVALCPDADAPVADVAQVITAEYEDEAALQQLLDQTAAVTLEFENIPKVTARFVESQGILRPGVKALEIAQDRRLEKTFISKLNDCQVADFRIIESEADVLKLSQAEAKNQAKKNSDTFSFPAILKTARDGYDGKGQVRIAQKEELAAAWQQLGQVPCVLETMIDFEQELSILVARDVHGGCVTYLPFLNEHENHILARSWAGADIPQWAATAAEAAAKNIAHQLDYVGCLCVELFQCQDRLLVNEIAPRPHNSGHATIEAYTISQFEQQVRALVGLPVIQPELRRPMLLMNLLGENPLFPLNSRAAAEKIVQLLQLPGVHYHNYGKTEAKPGRKMGHLTLEAPTFEALKALHQKVEQVLG